VFVVFLSLVQLVSNPLHDVPVDFSIIHCYFVSFDASLCSTLSFRSPSHYVFSTPANLHTYTNL
jgi:hypothetical protein